MKDELLGIFIWIVIIVALGLAYSFGLKEACV